MIRMRPRPRHRVVGPIMRRVRAELNRRRVRMPMEIWLVLLARGFVRMDADPMGTQSRMAATIVHDLFRMYAHRRNMYDRLVML